MPSRDGYHPISFNHADRADRLAAVGDLWAGILDSGADLAAVLTSGEDVTTS